MDEILKALKRRNIGKFEIFQIVEEKEPVVFQQNELQSLEFKKVTGIGLRIIKDGKLGFSSTTDMRNADELVDYALESAKFGEEVEFDFPEIEKYAELPIYNPAGWDIEERIKLGEKLLKEISKFGDVETDIEFTFQKKRLRIINSGGLDISYEKTLYNLTLEGLTVLPSGIAWLYEHMISTSPLKNVEIVLEKLKEKLTHSQRVYPVKAGYYPVIIAPQVARSILLALLLGVNGINVEKGISPLQSKKGERILKNLTLIDDPHRAEMMEAKPFDDEGIKTEKRYILENGVLKTFLLDLKTAAKLKEKPTGHAKRSYDSPPLPSPSNIIIEGGDRSLEEIISSLDYGLLIYSDIGGGQSNLLAGDFSLNVGLGLVIENGEIKGRAKDTMISGNFYNSFNEEIEFSKEREVFHNLLIPYMVLKGVRITSKEG